MRAGDAPAGPRWPRRKVLAAAACFGAAAVAGPAMAGRALVTRPGLAFGTTVTLNVVGRDRRMLERALDRGFAEIRTVEQAMSLFDPESDLSRLNRDGRIERPHPALVELLRLSLDLAAASGGAFDPTVQPLWTLWRRATEEGRRPTPAELRDALALVDHCAVDLSEGVVRLLRPGMALTLNGIAQGYAADRVVAALQSEGVEALFVDTGEFAARGRRLDGEGWALAVAHPRRPGETVEAIHPFTGFAATSGDYETTFSPDFADHHIVDPRTGRSPPELASVTVEAPSGALADGLSTAVFVLGWEGGRALVRRWPGTRLHGVAKDGGALRLLAPSDEA